MNTDAELIAAHDEGDSGAFPGLVRAHIKHIYTFSRNLLGNDADAEDATQETFIKAWKNLKKFRRGGNFNAWLYAIAHNVAIDQLRKRRSKVFSDFAQGDGSNSLEDTLADDEPNPQEVFARAEDRVTLQRAVMSLSEGYREVLYLYYDEDLTFDEIGKILGKPLHTVKSQHRRALLALRKHLSK